MMESMVAQMGEERAKAVMKLEYVFPKKIKSVAPEGAIMSEDKKTVIIEVDEKILVEKENKTLENFEVVLEEQ